MGPAVGTVVGDEHGHIAEDGHAVFGGIGPDIVHWRLKMYCMNLTCDTAPASSLPY